MAEIILTGWCTGGCWFTLAPNFSQGIMCRVTPQEWGILVIIPCGGGAKGLIFQECPAPRVSVTEHFGFSLFPIIPYKKR